ncbi:draxin-B isoform X1 [Salmo salar]|uniref:Draxin-B n=2 Tax=Salmo salar TaxID=8030 RepID=DRXIB_SALSA|nr:draxin-B isoform X1 [Salmo salar]XP_014022094.1 draxin-B isoform X1 [Salmo salar]XP_014022095.1 draxin-B isoform X1 [Salmo salar]XP_014022096.1 draxin-B isoform X1 [Salmo salar]B5X1Q3.1 RecName: Full=Draxin-B; AltName: Full=Dorsal inhibitory axon guidance protein B; AltName: Full=Dorsal repulsive axon guidance protein B; Flags: Precursor [Salmo salar]ACI33234.1 C1orf187 precursor [Salmo salar]|eukprot:XP_014022093.1 PREDICTED: draxin-B isoform X1 [Salmo salar]
MASSWCLPLALLVSNLAVSHSAEPSSTHAKRRLAQPSPGNGNALQYPEQGFQSHGHGNVRERGGRHGGQGAHSAKANTGAGLLSRSPLHPAARHEDDGTGLDGLSPVRLEMGPGGRERENGRGGFRNPSHARENHPLGPHKGKAQGHGHHFDHRRHGGRRDKGRHTKGFFPEPELDSSLKEGSVSSTIFGSGSSAVTTVMSEHPPMLPPASTKPKKSGRGKVQGEVMPTLDMTLFDWTDYEDMKPVDAWPSSRKKDKRRSKNLSSGNVTVDSDAIEPCDHHLDCLPGSCCDLRQHECKLHNRGLNNKCYDDCMCEEGFRCYAKFHRKLHVTRRRGRCVVPESANRDQGAFITV